MLTDVEIPGIAIEAELGHGEHSVVYRGRHGAAACVVKMPRVAGRWSRWVYREALTFARVRHPGLPRVLEVGEAGDVPYLVTELVRGETLAERLTLGPLPEEEVVDLGIHLANMLAAVHDAGLVHRDVKPRNVMLDVQGAMRLVDFGFAAPTEARIAANDGGAAGTYAAPEELCVPARVDARADLYALGRVLFESLACRLPRSSDDRELLAELSELDVGPALSRIVRGLVAFDPDERYPDARAVLADLHQASEGAPARGPHGYSRSPATGLVRGSELDRIRRVYDEAELGRGAAVVLVGERGSGKTRLVEALLADVRAQGGAVFDAACREGDAPLAALRRVCQRGIASVRRDLPDGGASLAGTVRASATENLRPIAAAFAPELAEMIGPISPVALEAGAFAEGAAEFIVRLARRLGPLAICVDDAHWLDAASADVFARVAHRAPEAPLLLLATTRADGDPGLLERLAGLGARRVDLAPLDDDRIAILVASHLGEVSVPRGVTNRVTTLARPTPLGVLEVVGALLDAGALRRKAGGWRLDATRAATVALSPGTLGLVGRRLAELSPATRRALEAGAILGASFDDDLLARVLDSEADPRSRPDGAGPRSRPVDRRELDFGLADARRAGLVQSEGPGEHRFVHDSLRELVLGQLEPEARRELHQRVGDVLSELGDTRVETLCATARHLAAGHVDAAPARAVDASLAAARAALTAHDSDASLRHLQTARSLAERSGIELDATYHVAAGEALLRLGDLEPSLRAFEAGLARATGLLTRATILGRIAWVHQTGADPRRAWDALERAFEEAGAHMPIESARALAATLRDAASVEIERFRPRRAAAEDPARAELLSDLHYQNARLGLEFDRPLRFVQSTLRALELSEVLGPSRGRARALAHYGVLLTVVGRRDAGKRELANAERMSTEIGQPAIAAYCVHLQAVVAAYGGDFASALARFGECLDEYGPWLELNEYCRNVVNAEALEALRGRAPEALAWIERAIGRVKRTPLAPAGLITALCLHAAAARAAVGQEPDEDPWLVAQIARPIPTGDRDRFYRHIAWAPRARLLLERGDVGAPLDALTVEFEADVHSTRFAEPCLIDYYFAIARGRVRACADAPRSERPRLLPALRRAAADLGAASRLPLVRAHTALVAGEIAWLEGAHAASRRRIAEAEALAYDEGCSFVLFGAARLRARLAQAEGRADVARDAARVAEMLARERGAVAPARSVRAEFDLPEPAASIRSATTSRVSARSRRQLSALLNVVSARGADLGLEQQAALMLDELVRDFDAERALLLFQSAPRGGHLVIGRDRHRTTFREADGWQEALLRRVRDRGDIWPFAVGPDAESDASRVLAAPLFVGDRSVGALVFEREPSGEAFDTDDRELLLVLSHQVPVVLEAARLLAEREQLQTSMSQAAKMEALGQLAGGVAHGFNNLLTALQASANAVRDRALADAEITAEVDVILQATGRATELTRQLLAFSRHRPRPLTPERANELLNRLEPRLKTLVGERIEVVLGLRADVHTMRGDRISFEQAVLNLAGNARDAMPNGGKLTIRTENVFADEAALRSGAPASGDYVCISVADTGCGMPPELVARVFEPFFSTRSSSGASGLGLTTVYAFAKNSGGWVALSSEVGRGTLVQLFLPRVDEVPSVRRAVKRGNESGGARTLLVVDDEEMLRKTVQRMLERAGYRVLVADGAAQAIELVEAHGDAIALAILDVLMPGVSGPELGRRLEEMRLPAKVLYMSGLAQESAIVTEAQVAEANVIQKPFATRELLERVRFLLDEATDEPS